jgi:hypothetical protein
MLNNTLSVHRHFDNVKNDHVKIQKGTSRIGKRPALADLELLTYVIARPSRTALIAIIVKYQSLGNAIRTHVVSRAIVGRYHD